MRKAPISDFGDSMSGLARLMLGAYLVVLNLMCLTLLFMIWPGIREMFPNIPINPPDEIRLLLISTVSGALGSAVIILVSFIEFSGHRALRGSWAWFYLARPIAGMTTGLFLYIAIRGGILKTGSGVTVDVLNPYTVAIIAALGGAFSHEILAKLKAFADRQLSTK